MGGRADGADCTSGTVTMATRRVSAVGDDGSWRAGGRRPAARGWLDRQVRPCFPQGAGRRCAGRAAPESCLRFVRRSSCDVDRCREEDRDSEEARGKKGSCESNSLSLSLPLLSRSRMRWQPHRDQRQSRPTGTTCRRRSAWIRPNSRRKTTNPARMLPPRMSSDSARWTVVRSNIKAVFAATPAGTVTAAGARIIPGASIVAAIERSGRRRVSKARFRALPAVCQNSGHVGTLRSTPGQESPLQAPEFLGYCDPAWA